MLDFLDHRPENLEVVLTGRAPSDELKRRADYISEVRMEKHPYTRGLAAREGIEY
jgi:cob(I)alamin adenosyltransferase